MYTSGPVLINVLAIIVYLLSKLRAYLFRLQNVYDIQDR